MFAAVCLIGYHAPCWRISQHRKGYYQAKEKFDEMKLLARKIRSVAVLQTEHAHLGKSLYVCNGSESVHFVKPSKAAAFVVNVRPSQCDSKEEVVR